MSDDGVLTVTSPSGITRTTRPPGMRPPRPTEDPPRDGDETLPLQVEPDDELPPF
jgi:hypothetical protein